MAAFDPRDRGEVGAARGNAGFGGGGNRNGGQGGRGGQAAGPDLGGWGISQGMIDNTKARRNYRGPAGGFSSGSTDPSLGGGANGQGGRGGNTFSGQTPMGNSTTADQQMAEKYGVTPDRYNQETADYRDRLTDAMNSDNTTAEDLGNLVAGFLGFNEQTPDQIDFDPTKPVGPRADWSWDPVGVAAGVGGGFIGAPGLGMITDQVSQQLGRPLSISLGPDVFGGPTTDPVTGETIAGDTTVQGPSVTVHDPNDANTFMGVSPTMGSFLNGVSNNLPPRTSTLTGSNPDTPATTPSDPYQPVTPQPTPIDTPPNSPIQVDPGNTQMSPDELTSLFLGFMKPRTSMGRNPASVIV
jgi:hypothetical protein